MMSLDIEQEISSVLKRGRVSSSAALEGFIVDAQYFLNESGQFANVRVKKTGDARAAVVITCSVAEASLSTREVVEVLERIWTEELAYGSERHDTHIAPERIALRFMSEGASEGLFVTGRIIVDATAARAQNKRLHPETGRKGS